MYKVLFAEDELLVRLGLQNSIPWSKYQMELSALAENGIEAFRLFESIRPDVLITDLRMEGMDGVELVKRVRQIDKDCAIVVVSCMNDFETLRKLIPYNINAYVLKASISIDEVCDALQNVQEYLIRIGRKTDKAESSNDTLETHISKFLLGKIANCTWEKTDFMEYMLLFSLKDEDQTKINALAMEFIYELVRRQLPNKLLIPLILPKKVDYSLLLTFIAFFVFIGNMKRIDLIREFLNQTLRGRELLLSFGCSQIISNVPAAILLSGFTDQYAALLRGVNIGGLGTLIASLASLISYKFFAESQARFPEAGSKQSYILRFTIWNVGMAIILLLAAVMLDW